MITPALLIIPLLTLAGRRAEHPRVKGTIRAIVMASAGLLWAAAIPLASEAATDPITLGIIALSLAVLLTHRGDHRLFFPPRLHAALAGV